MSLVQKPSSGAWFRLALLGALAILGAGFLRAGPLVESWARRYGSPFGDAVPQALAVDAVGNCYITGKSMGINGSYECATVGYAASGQPLWTNRYNGCWGLGIAVAPKGERVYVCGGPFTTLAYSSAGLPLWTNIYIDPYHRPSEAQVVGVDGEGTVYVAGTAGGMVAHYVVASYSAAGIPLWTNHYFGPGITDQVTDMVVDKSGIVYVTGWSRDSNNSPDYATIAYSAAGTPLWTNRYTTAGLHNDSPQAIAVDEDGGNVYVTGWSIGEGTGRDYATVAYSRSGIPLWTNRYEGPLSGDDYGLAVAVGGSGNVYVTGPIIDGGATLAYSSTGLPLWTNRADGAGEAIVVDKVGNVVVAGGSWTPESGYDFMLVVYSSAGSPLSTNTYNGGGYDYVTSHCLACGPDGSIYVTGASEANFEDYTTIKYVPSPDISLAEVARLPNLSCRLTLSAPANVAFRLEASGGLSQTWETLTNFPPLPVTSLQYTDALAPLFPTRFYRAVWSP